MTLPPHISDMIRQGAGYQVVRAVFELVKRHGGMVNPRTADPSVGWALSTARLLHLHDPGDHQGMESCVIVLAVALPQQYRNLALLLPDAAAVREWSETTHPSTSKRARRKSLPPGG